MQWNCNSEILDYHIMTLLLTGRKMPAQSTLGTIANLVWLFSYVTEKQSNSAQLQLKEWSVAGKAHSEKVDKSKNKFSTATFKFWFKIEMITNSGGFWLAYPSSGGLRLADPSFLHHALCVQLQFGRTEKLHFKAFVTQKMSVAEKQYFHLFHAVQIKTVQCKIRVKLLPFGWIQVQRWERVIAPPVVRELHI